MEELKNTVPSEDYLLEVENLTKNFDVTKGMFKRKRTYLQAVDHVSFHIRKGETLGLVGESGCGKSTLGNSIIRLIEPTEGKVYFDGVDFTSLKGKELQKMRREMQMIFQDPFSSLNPRLRVFSIIAEPLRIHNMCKGAELEKRVFDLMDAVGLPASSADKYPHEFSGGQRQRIGIARALALNPKLIICDEPVSALDVSIQAQILNLLCELQHEFDLTYIFIAHGMPTVKHISTNVAVMYLGQVVEFAPKTELFGKPLHPYTEGLLQAVPIPDPTKRKGDSGKLMVGNIPSAIDPPSGCRFHTRCPYATEECKTVRPEFRCYGNDHYCACHHILEDGKGILG